MSDPSEIWLQPWCDGCEKYCYGGEGRQWCQDDIWGSCGECDKKAIKYVAEAQLARAKEIIAAQRAALEWYEEKATSAVRYLGDKNKIQATAAEALMIELMLDGGKRARAALALALDEPKP